MSADLASRRPASAGVHADLDGSGGVYADQVTFASGVHEGDRRPGERVRGSGVRLDLHETAPVCGAEQRVRLLGVLGDAEQGQAGHLVEGIPVLGDQQASAGGVVGVEVVVDLLEDVEVRLPLQGQGLPGLAGVG